MRGRGISLEEDEVKVFYRDDSQRHWLQRDEAPEELEVVEMTFVQRRYGDKNPQAVELKDSYGTIHTFEFETGEDPPSSY